MHDVITFISKYMEMFLGLIFICIIIVVQLISLSKIVKYQNQSIQALGNSYVAIFRVNPQIKKYVSIKQSEFYYYTITETGDYDDLLASFNAIMDNSTKKEFNKYFSTENIIKLSQGEVHEFGGDFKWEVNGKSNWMNVTVLFDKFLSNGDVLICFFYTNNSSYC